MVRDAGSGVHLYWLPLGAGGWFVRLNGKAYEALVAFRDGRARRDLYHSALVVGVRDGRFVIESAPVGSSDGAARGVFAEGAVGTRGAGRTRLFRYELRCWRDGVIPDVEEAVDSPQPLTSEPEIARRVLDLAPLVPTPVWGRDELGTGDMWNSNSVIAWLVERAGLDAGSRQPPAGGRAPGWSAGVVVARRVGTEPLRTEPGYSSCRERSHLVAWSRHHDVDRGAPMNRFEQAVYDCMIPTAELLAVTTKPLHRAILLNFWRHVHLEGAGEYERIVAADMMVDEPVYRVTWGASPAVITGKDGVLAFYNSVGESVLWHSDDRLAVGDWGICDEITFHQLARGADLTAVGYEVDDPDALYHASSRQAFIWPYDARARLAGEHLYEDKTSLVIEEVAPEEAITPARVREIHREQLAKLEAEHGERFWVLSDDA